MSSPVIKYSFIITILFFPIKTFCQGDAATVESGIVISSVTNTPIEGATILLYQAKTVVITNE